ncbi:DBH-like monooxygenase protein 1 [Hypsibius exemplaris]|uniref:DBH-like monooxygenase protein 1 n=1 Tax=Hypsibius exemplaris TaxID=2072580 RepID=A0A1W0WLA8_HYPEX|nr:DBH-like monooxygenase protein 1 [Hypsibius exemplaris]
MVLRLWNVLLFACLNLAIIAEEAQADFTHEVLLDAGNDYWLRWSYTGDSIDIEASAKTLGWLAFGFSRDGGMDKSDVLFGYVNASSGRANISDRYLVADGTNVQLLLDRQQDWELLTATRNQTHTSIRVRRKLETCDPQDHPITKDTMRVIFSLDQQPPTDFLHPTMHNFRGTKSILFLDDSLAVRKLGVPILAHATLEWNVLMDGVTIPESATSRFHCKLLKIPPFNRKYHIVKVEPKIESENIDLVRQILVSVCNADTVTDATIPEDFVCGIAQFGDHTNPQQTSVLSNCTTLLAAWAVGASTLVYPDDAGYPIGPELSGRYVLLQTQYVNGPLQKRVDSSGLKFGLSDKLRKYDAGIVVLGVSGNAFIPPSSPSFTHYGQCSDSCTKQGIPEDGVTIFGGSFHSNRLGRSMTLRQIRDGVELPPLLQDRKFDTSFQANRGVYPNRKLMRGDQLTLECTYGMDTKIGAPTTDEICFGVVLHYPRVNMTSCRSSYLSNTMPIALGLRDNSRAHSEDSYSNSTTVGNDTTTGTTTPSEREIALQLANLTWTAGKINALQTAFRDSSLLAQCHFENGYDVNEEHHRMPFIPAQEPNSTCAALPAALAPLQQQTPSQTRAKSAAPGNSRINPIYPFERRAPGVYVFTHYKTNNLYSGFWILFASAVFFGYIGSQPGNKTFSQLDQIFFPCIGILISLYILWMNIWPLTVVLNYPKFRYEYYVGEQIVSVGPIVDAYVKLKVLFAGEEDMFYHIVIGATDMPELEFTWLSPHGQIYRKVAKRLARTLHLNYFDIMDLSHLHECRHATTRHMDSLLEQETGMLRVVQREIQRNFLTRKIDLLKRPGGNPLDVLPASYEQPNWPFEKVEELNLGVPLERVVRLRKERRAKETIGWRIRQMPRLVRACLRTIKIAMVGRHPDDDHVQLTPNPVHRASAQPDEEELDEALKAQLIAQLDVAEGASTRRKWLRPFLPFRTGQFNHMIPLSVEDRAMMRRIARYMALRTLVRQAGLDVPGMTEDLSFMGLYTAHEDYATFYQAEMERFDPHWRRHGMVISGKVHPIVAQHEYAA